MERQQVRAKCEAVRVHRLVEQEPRLIDGRRVGALEGVRADSRGLRAGDEKLVRRSVVSDAVDVELIDAVKRSEKGAKVGIVKPFGGRLTTGNHASGGILQRERELLAGADDIQHVEAYLVADAGVELPDLRGAGRGDLAAGCLAKDAGLCGKGGGVGGGDEGRVLAQGSVDTDLVSARVLQQESAEVADVRAGRCGIGKADEVTARVVDAELGPAADDLADVEERPLIGNRVLVWECGDGCAVEASRKGDAACAVLRGEVPASDRATGDRTEVSSDRLGFDDRVVREEVGGIAAGARNFKRAGEPRFAIDDELRVVVRIDGAVDGDNELAAGGLGVVAMDGESS
ncbi:MAG: hypothetical protein JNL18_22930 [Planctomycetaceae bacterium]|nr:hypothetical protein [Planctomycetaceae bacterium]